MKMKCGLTGVNDISSAAGEEIKSSSFAAKRAGLKALFPGVCTETTKEDGILSESVDFEKLKAELGTFSDVFETRRECYGMEWSGKRGALQVI